MVDCLYVPAQSGCCDTLCWPEGCARMWLTVCVPAQSGCSDTFCQPEGCVVDCLCVLALCFMLCVSAQNGCDSNTLCWPDLRIM